MGDLISDLLKAIEAREKIARECDGERWKWDLIAQAVMSESGDWVACGRYGDFVTGDYALHMVYNDPSSVLRRCEADRKIVEIYRDLCSKETGQAWDLSTRTGAHMMMIRVLDALASAYSVSVDTEGE